jgi:hypothetical protein
LASRRDIAFLAASSLRVENSAYGIALAVIAKRGCDKAHYYLDERANTRPLFADEGEERHRRLCAHFYQRESLSVAVNRFA